MRRCCSAYRVGLTTRSLRGLECHPLPATATGPLRSLHPDPAYSTLAAERSGYLYIQHSPIARRVQYVLLERGSWQSATTANRRCGQPRAAWPIGEAPQPARDRPHPGWPCKSNPSALIPGRPRRTRSRPTRPPMTSCAIFSTASARNKHARCSFLAPMVVLSAVGRELKGVERDDRWGRTPSEIGSASKECLRPAAGACPNRRRSRLSPPFENENLAERPPPPAPHHAAEAEPGFASSGHPAFDTTPQGKEHKLGVHRYLL